MKRTSSKESREMRTVESYIVNVSRKQASRWYGGVDIPPPLYWRYQDKECTKTLPDEQMTVTPGDVLELVEVICGASSSYYGILVGAVRELQVLRRMRLSADGTSYQELVRSREYEQQIAEGALTELEGWRGMPRKEIEPPPRAGNRPGGA